MTLFSSLLSRLALFGLICCIGACGQKGPLYAPIKPPPISTPYPTKAPTSAPTAQPKQDPQEK